MANWQLLDCLHNPPDIQDTKYKNKRASFNRMKLNSKLQNNQVTKNEEAEQFSQQNRKTEMIDEALLKQHKSWQLQSTTPDDL